ncbi:hypothetical protein BC628DRAFT_1422492 [Trametes gibbosa]|nr:hypothetical protein BC628DRAFT_1422492 [Trametes gibbosa]
MFSLLCDAARFLRFVYTIVSQLFPEKPRWTADHLPDLRSKVVIVTGGNTGIGRETVRRLLLKDAKVYMATRSQERAERAIDKLREETGKQAFFLHLDLDNLNSVREAAEEFKRFKPHKLVYEAYRDGPVRSGMHMFDRYCQSKCCAVVLSMFVARTFAKDNVVSITVDPGYIKSEIYRSSPWYLQLRIWDWLYWYSVKYGAIGPLYAAAASDGATLNGKYLRPWACTTPPNPLALVENEQEKLWAWLDEQVKPYM